MGYKGNRSHERMDAIAAKLGGKIGNGRGLSPRLQMVSGGVVLALSAASIFAAVIGLSHVARGLGFLSFLLGLVVAYVVQRGYQSVRGDERERLVQASAYSTAGSFVACAFILWALANSFETPGIGWVPQDKDGWRALCFAGIGALYAVVIFVIGYQTPAYAADLDEND